MSYENEPASMKQRIIFMSAILGVMAIILYFVLNAEGIAPKKDAKPPVAQGANHTMVGVAFRIISSANFTNNYNRNHHGRSVFV